MFYNIPMSWRTKVLLIICGTIIILFIFVSLFNIKIVNSVTSSLLKENVTLLTSIIENALTSPMLEGKVEMVQRIISNIPHNTDIINFKVISPDGKILSSSSPEEVGHEASFELKEGMVETSEKGIPIFSFQKVPVFFQVKAIKNESRCYGCHSSSNKVNGFLAIKIDYKRAQSLLTENIKRGLLVLAFSLIFVITLITITLNSLVNKPVLTILEKMKEVEKGNLNVRIDTEGKDEIATLVKGFNGMVEKLKESIKEREKAHKEDLRRAEHLASIGELAAGLAHEIKNPLTGIKGAIEVLIEKEKGENKEILSEILNQINRTTNVLQNFLLYARPKQPVFTLASLEKIIEDSITISKYHTRGKNIDLEFICPSNIKNIFVDPDQIQEVLVNLIINSIDAIESKGKVEIRACPKEDGVEIRIRDTGKGIKEEELPFIFKPFFTTKPKGSGLGLSISRRLIENHRGSITVESKEGSGTVVKIFLPYLGNKE